MALTPFMVDGKSVQIDSDPQMPLLYALRDDLKLNNPKFGCGLAQCGACTVHLEGQAVRSCVVPVSAVKGKKSDHLGRFGNSRKTAPHSGGIFGRASAAVWSLHQWLGHDLGRIFKTQPQSDRCRDQNGPRGFEVPLRDACVHFACHQARPNFDGLRSTPCTNLQIQTRAPPR